MFEEANMSQFSRYAIVGVLSNASGYFAYLLVTWAGLDPKISMSMLYCIGATIGYYGNRQWAFSYRGGVASSAARYAMAHLVGYCINLLLLITLVDKLGYPHQWVQAAAVVVVASVLFILFRLFVFPQKDAPVRSSR